jgi:hypothetical protein
MGGAGLIGHTGRHAHGALGDAPHPNARPPPVERAVRQLRGRHCDPHCSLLNEQHLPQPTQRPLCTSPSTQLPFSPALISRPSRAAACGERRGQVREFTRGIGEPGPHANVTQPLPGPNIGETPPLNRATFGRVLKHSPPKGLLRHDVTARRSKQRTRPAVFPHALRVLETSVIPGAALPPSSSSPADVAPNRAPTPATAHPAGHGDI